MNNHEKNDQIRRDRSGMFTVEFALLLPFFALVAAAILMLGHLFYRSVGQSYAAFSAARRCAVQGSAGAAGHLVRRDYRACSMPGEPGVSAQFSAGRPGFCTVEIRDRVPAIFPDSGGRLSVQFRSGAIVKATAAGCSSYAGGDNDL